MKQKIFDIFTQKGYDPKQDYQNKKLDFQYLAGGDNFIIKIKASEVKSYKFYSIGEEIFRYRQDNFFKESAFNEKDLKALCTVVSRFLPPIGMDITSSPTQTESFVNSNSDLKKFHYDQTIEEDVILSLNDESSGNPKRKKLRIDTNPPSNSPQQSFDILQVSDKLFTANKDIGNKK